MSNSKLQISDDTIYMGSQLVSSVDTYVWLLKFISVGVEEQHSIPLFYYFKPHDQKKYKDNHYWGSIKILESSNNELDIYYDIQFNRFYSVSLQLNLSFSIIDNENNILVKNILNVTKSLTTYGLTRIIKGFINNTLKNILQRSVFLQPNGGRFYLLHQLNIVPNNKLEFTIKDVNTINKNQIVITKPNFGKLLEEQQFSDITLRSQDATEFKAHKAILACQSDVFAKMFVHDMKEKNTSVIEISDVKGNVIEELLKFFYTGKLSKIEEMAGEMLLVADKYNVDGLKMLCSEEIKQNLTSDNAIAALLLADKCVCEILVSAVIKFIVMQESEIMKTAEFEAMKKSHPHLIEKIMNMMIQYY